MACVSQFSAEVKNDFWETTVNVPVYVQNVKRIIEEKYPGLKFPPGIDEIVERCLRTHKFDCTQAATQVHSFFKYLYDCRKLHGEMHFLPSNQKEYFFDSMGVAILKNRDSKGRVVYLARMECTPSRTYNVDKALAACFMALDEATRCSVDNQRLGVVIVLDLSGYDFGHARQYTLARLQLFAQIIQGSIPIRFKGLHIVRSPKLFTYTYALLKPLLKEEIRKRIHFHSHDLNNFHKDVSPDILPEYLGGKIPDNEYADLEFKRALCAKDDYYKDLFRYGYFTDEGNGDH